jgi:hypothetical protein
MVVCIRQSLLSAKAGQRLVDQPISHTRIAGQAPGEPAVSRAQTPPVRSQENAGGNP